MESEYGWKNAFLFVLSFLLFGSFLILLLEILNNFIKSKPPGRRLVSDFIFKNKNKKNIAMFVCR